ncbi:MAG TPA: maleylpyruvate isomerase family mycothiol-dependent enzyme [Acidimicrobiia bacterium]|nr:maleylpyruvate isomerase family mycothiol-dependent enzyme [Acidimicrobiia bacterium]
MTATLIETIAPIARTDARELAATEHGRLTDLLRTLSPDDWSQATDCPLWDVRAMAGHSVGMMADFTSFRSLMRRMRAATKASKKGGKVFIDVMTAMQVADHAGLSTALLIARAEEVGPKAARWRNKAPALFRRMPMKEEVGGQTETWRMGYLLDTILTRDPWMHRVDISRATGRDLVLTPEHDGRIVADVVAEWARRHGQPFTLTLTGPAGGEFVGGDGSREHITIDALEFCRTLSGRAAGEGLLSQQVPF